MLQALEANVVLNGLEERVHALHAAAWNVSAVLLRSKVDEFVPKVDGFVLKIDDFGLQK